MRWILLSNCIHIAMVLQAKCDFPWQTTMLKLVNEARSQAGKAPLCLNKELNKAASDYAVVIAKSNVLDHNADGTAGSRAERAGFKFLDIAENLATEGTPENAHKRLLDSPQHKANILGDFEFFGVGGVTQGDQHTGPWVQMFGSSSNGAKCSDGKPSAPASPPSSGSGGSPSSAGNNTPKGPSGTTGRSEPPGASASAKASAKASVNSRAEANVKSASSASTNVNSHSNAAAHAKAQASAAQNKAEASAKAAASATAKSPGNSATPSRANPPIKGFSITIDDNRSDGWVENGKDHVVIWNAGNSSRHSCLDFPNGISVCRK